MILSGTLVLVFASCANAHIAAWVNGMYCRNVSSTFSPAPRHVFRLKFPYVFKGTSGQDNPNTNEAVQPLYMLPKEQWWSEFVL